MNPRRSQEILVVDDDPTFTDLLAELFEMEGYRVEQASDGEQALQILERGNPPDLLLSDIMMPKLDGLELVAAARRLYDSDRLPILLVSAGRDPSLDAERVAFLRKPVDLEGLLDQVRMLLNGHDSTSVDRAGGPMAGRQSRQPCRVVP